MRGQKPGFDLGIRKIFAKIQREFDYPRVVIVRCRIKPSAASLKLGIPVKTQRVPTLATHATSLQTSFPISTRQAALATLEVQSVQPMSQLTTSVIAVPCYINSCPEVIRPGLVLPQSVVASLPFEVPGPQTKAIPVTVVSPTCLTTEFALKTRIRGGPMLARTLPFYLKVQRIQDLNKGVLIRYRAAVLKQIGNITSQIKMIGIVTNLPKAPLSMVRYEIGTRDGLDQVLVRLHGDTNPSLGRRTWVFVQLDGKDKHIHLTVREEEA